MKQYTTKFLKSVAALYLAFPVVYLFIVVLLFDIPPSRLLAILLSPSFYFVSLLAMIVGYSLWEMHRWGWYLFVATNVLIAYQNAVLLNEYGETHHKFLSFMVFLGGLLAISYRVAREVRVPYFFPKIRWWESNPRYRLAVPVKVTQLGQEFEGQILDVSAGGCFVKLREEITQHEAVKLQYSVFGFDMECEGIVVWRSESTVTRPKGVGVKFTVLTREQRRVLRQITLRLRRIASLHRRARDVLSEADLQKRIQEIEEYSGPLTG